MYDHALKIIEEDPKYAGIFLGTGCGKTAVASCLAEGRTLVVCPKTQKQDRNWQRELEKDHVQDYLRLTSMDVISKEEFRRDWESLPAYDTVIFDEAHYMSGVTPSIKWKNRKQYPKTSQLFERSIKYIEKTKPKRFYPLTATPARTPMAVYALWALLRPGQMTFENYLRFRDMFYFPLARQRGQAIYVPRNTKKAMKELSIIVSRLGYVGRLEDFLDVPEQTEKVHYVDPSQGQKVYLKEAQLDFPNPLVLFGKTHQIENGCFNDSYNFVDIPHEKIKALQEYTYEFDKILVFARFTQQVKYYKKVLTEAGHNVLTLTGNTKDKGEVIAKANSLDKCIVIAQTSISAGYELPEFPCVVFASLSGSLVDLVQGKGRVQRLNNIKKNLYVYLVTRKSKFGGADEAIYNTNVLKKQEFHEEIYVKSNII